MSDIKIKQSLLNLGNALDRLQDALAEPEHNSLIVDGTIQRFEFAIELFWKTLKRLLSAEGVDANTPKEVLKKAYAVHWIDDETVWLQMLRDRNETSHVYNEDKAEEIFQRIKTSYYSELRKVFEFLQTK